MKRRDLLTKQVIKAITLGLSAAMMMQPISALADAPAENPEETNTEVVTEDETVTFDTADAQAEISENQNKATKKEADEAVAAADEVLKLDDNQDVADAKDALDEAADKLVKDVEAVVEDEQPGEEDDAEGEGERTEPAPVPETENTNSEPVIAEDRLIEAPVEYVAEEAEVTAQDNLEAAEADIEAAEAEDLLADAAWEAANKAADDAADAVKGILDTENNADKNLDDEIKKLDNADNYDDAETAYNNAKTIVEDADKAYDDVKSAYDDAKANYDKSKAALIAAQAEYEKALTDAKDNAADAKAKLEAAEKRAEELKAVADAALAELNKCPAVKIADLEADVKEASDEDVEKIEDSLMEEIIKSYLVSNIIDADASEIEIKSDDEHGDFVVSYIDKDGLKQEKRLNYSSLNSGENNNGIVIFEETESFVYDENGSKFTLSDDEKAKLAAGEIVALSNGKFIFLNNGAYVVVTDKEAEKISLSNTEEKVEKIVENTESTTIGTDNDGNIVRETTAEVETTVYTSTDEKKSVSSEEGKLYATEAEAKAAAEELIAASVSEGSTLKKDSEKITMVPFTEYTATADYYVSRQVTKKVDLDGVNGWKSAVSYSKDEAIDNAIDEIADQVDKDDLLVSIDDADLSASKDGWGYYDVDGTIKYTYVDTTTQKADYSLIGDFFGITGSTSDVEKKIDEKLEKEGKYVRVTGLEGWDWTIFRGTYEVTDLYKATATGATEEEAKANAQKLANEQAAKMGDGVKAVLLEGRNKATKTKEGYAFEAEFTETTVTSETSKDTKVIESTTWTADEQAKAALKYTDDKLESGDILLSEYDNDELTKEQKAETEEFRKFVDSASEKRDAYDKLSTEADEADKAAEQAEEEVAELERQINELLNDTHNTDELEDLEDKLGEVTSELENAGKIKAVIDEKGEGLKKPEKPAEPEEEEPVEPEEEEPEEPEEEEPVEPEEEEPVVPEENEPEAPAEEPETNENDQTPVEEVEIPAEEVPTTETPAVEEPEVEEPVAEDTKTEETVIDNSDVELTKDPVEIEINPEDTPLGDMEGETMSWWWTLIVLALGAAGAELYRRYLAKKNAAKINNIDKN